METMSEQTNSDFSTLPGIIILTHGDFGKALIESAKMIYGELEKVEALSLQPREDPDSYRTRLENLLDSMPEDSLILVDLFGGTPCNTLVSLSKNRKINALSGVCMSMILEAATQRSTLSGKEWVKAVAEATSAGIVDIGGMLEQ